MGVDRKGVRILKKIFRFWVLSVCMWIFVEMDLPRST